MNVRIVLAALLALPLLAACGPGDGEATEAAADAAAVDTAFTPAESARRFRAGIPSADALGGAYAPSRDSLVARVVAALARADTAALAGMALNRAEFAYLYYETSPVARPGYELPADVAWLQLSAGSGKGLTRMLRALGGRELALAGYDCPAAVAQGQNRVHAGCTVRLRSPAGEEQSLQLFGALVERGGRHKVLTFANDF